VTFGCLSPQHVHSGDDWPDLAALARERGFTNVPAT
jgi:hypothetical protein